MTEHEKCEWALAVMLLFTHPTDNDQWYVWCVEEAMRHRLGSYTHIFWWSLRELDGDLETDRLEGHQPLVAWRDYLNWKLEQHGYRR